MKSPPFYNLNPEQRKKVFWFFLALSFVLMLLMNVVGASLNTQAAPFGIISFELAGSVTRAEEIISSWDHNTQLRAAFSLGLDFLFMPAYAAAISLACLWAADMLGRAGWPLAALGPVLAWGQWLAAFLDLVENIGLTAIILGTPVSPWPELAFWCAAIKFILVFAGIVYAFMGLVVVVMLRIRPES